MAKQLKVLSLNCWGVPIAKERKLRIKLIGEHLATCDYDIIGLQELWVEEDFDTICDAVRSVFPFNQFFPAGIIGSGLAILSRYPIAESLFHRFRVNGKPQRILHADWFGGKGIGCCRIIHPTIGMVSAYTTHLIAEYSKMRSDDEYLSCRVAQSCEAALFIRSTAVSHGGRAIFIGDMNLEPGDVGVRIFLALANLRDTWIEYCETVGDDCSARSGNTCDVDTNVYSRIRPSAGKRIDYIFRSAGLRSTSVRVVMDKAPTDHPKLSFSDHFGVEATLSAHDDSDAIDDVDEAGLAVIEEALEILYDGTKDINIRKFYHVRASWQWIFLFAVLWIILLLAILCDSYISQLYLQWTANNHAAWQTGVLAFVSDRRTRFFSCVALPFVVLLAVYNLMQGLFIIPEELKSHRSTLSFVNMMHQFCISNKKKK